MPIKYTEGDLEQILEWATAGNIDPNDPVAIAAAEELLRRVEEHMRSTNHIAVVNIANQNTPLVSDN